MEKSRGESGVLFEASSSEAGISPQLPKDNIESLPTMGEIYGEFEEREGFLLARLGTPSLDPIEAT